MLISAIVAVSENNVIGREGHLPWHLSQDLKRFKAITTGHAIILGRKNYNDIGRPLPNRTNYVLSRNKEFQAPGCIVCSSLGEAIEAARAAGETECFIIGGAAVYREAMSKKSAKNRSWLTKKTIFRLFFKFGYEKNKILLLLEFLIIYIC